MSDKLIKALAVTVELTQTEITPAAARVMAADLSAYPEDQVLAALVRCRRELKGRLTLADIITRIDDGRPGPEEAWSMIPKESNDCTDGRYTTDASGRRRWVESGSASVVWTPEMRQAFGTVYPMLQQGDHIPARMAFIERYKVLVQQARDQRQPVTWEFSPGTDQDGRERALLEAVEKGRMSSDAAQRLLPHHREQDGGAVARLLADGSPFKRITESTKSEPVRQIPEAIRKFLPAPAKTT